MIKVCEYCGKEFNAVRSSRKYCSVECKAKGYSKNMKGKLTSIKNKEKEIHICLNCGKEFEHKSDSTNTYCSQECWKEYKAKERERKYLETHTKRCKECGKEFMADNANVRFCGDECRNKYNDKYMERYNEKYRDKVIEEYIPRIFNCKECGKKVVAKYGDKRTQFCSEKCCRKYELKNNENTKLLRKEHKKRWKVKRRKYLKNNTLETFKDEEIYQRDNYICQICGKPVDMEADYNDNYAPTIDHIVPLSKGGKHCKSNVQLAHRICNSLKSDKVI